MTDEQAEVLGWFNELLRSVTADGGRKRAAGLKCSWKVDGSHEAAIFSHLNAWKHGVKVDHDSGVHPLVHLAWRALAIAWQETSVDRVIEKFTGDSHRWVQLRNSTDPLNEPAPRKPRDETLYNKVDAMADKWNAYTSDQLVSTPPNRSRPRKRRKPRDKRRVA